MGRRALLHSRFIGNFPSNLNPPKIGGAAAAQLQPKRSGLEGRLRHFPEADPPVGGAGKAVAGAGADRLVWACAQMLNEFKINGLFELEQLELDHPALHSDRQAGKGGGARAPCASPGQPAIGGFGRQIALRPRHFHAPLNGPRQGGLIAPPQQRQQFQTDAIALDVHPVVAGILGE